MLLNIIDNLIFAANPAPAGDAGGGIMSMVLMIGLLFFVMYFFMIRPQSKKQKALERMRNELKKNDRVLTTGGVIGFVTKIKDNEVTLKIDETSNVKMTFMRGAIVHILEAADSAEKTDDEFPEREDDKE